MSKISGVGYQYLVKNFLDKIKKIRLNENGVLKPYNKAS